jgi:hypothetical protein
VDAAFILLGGVSQDARVVFVMLEMRKPSHEARAAIIPDGLTRVEPRIQCVLTQWMC